MRFLPQLAAAPLPPEARTENNPLKLPDLRVPHPRGQQQGEEEGPDGESGSPTYPQQQGPPHQEGHQWVSREGRQQQGPGQGAAGGRSQGMSPPCCSPPYQMRRLAPGGGPLGPAAGAPAGRPWQRAIAQDHQQIYNSSSHVTGNGEQGVWWIQARP